MEYLSRRKNLTAIAYLLGGAGFAAAQSEKAIEHQPNMEAALEHLNQAKASLQKAEHNKGGHRDRAMQFVDQAIGEVRAGIGYAAQHP